MHGKKIMLDEDLAELYQVEIRRLNEQVKRNSVRFLNDFMFQLSEEEYGSLRSQFETLENGVYMLSAVLKSKVAIDVSIEIIKKVFSILDSLVNDTIKTDEKVMVFIKDA